MRVVFMGTPEFAVGALDAVHRHHEIVGVYTQADKPVGRGLELKPPPVKARAIDLGLPVHQPERLTRPEEVDKLRALKPDVIVVVAYGKILRREILEMPRLGCVNIHSSLLPRWRGAAPIQWAILGGDTQTGVTTMKLVEELDAGDILLQAETPIAPDETAGSLHDRLALMGAELIVPTLEGLEKGTIQPRPQDPSKVTFASKLTKEMERLDPEQPVEVMDRQVRALNPWPGTAVWIQGQRLKVKRARPQTSISGPKGELFEHRGSLFLGASRGALELLAVQWDGKKEVDGPGFLNGLKGQGKSLPLRLDLLA